MKNLLILAFCLCGALATPIIEDETQPDEMAPELNFVEERDDELVDKIEVEGEEIMRRKGNKLVNNCPLNRQWQIRKKRVMSSQDL